MLSIKETFIQAIKEFWIPISIAAIWTFYQLYTSDKPSVGSGIAHFSAAWLIASLVAMNWNRIRYQGTTKARLQRIDEAVQKSSALQMEADQTQKQILEKLEKLETLSTNDPQYQPAIADVTRLTLRANNELVQANTSMLQAVTASVTPWSLNPIYRIVAPPQAASSHSPVEVTLPSEGSKKEN
jgi:hypothetical protein